MIRLEVKENVEKSMHNKFGLLENSTQIDERKLHIISSSD